MSDEELQKIRQKRLEELREQQIQQQKYEEYQKQQEEISKQKEILLRQILSSAARARLQNLRISRPEYANGIEIQLIQLFQQGVLQSQMNLPLSDETFKAILKKSQEKNKRNTKIKII
jgi:programmed cell death protein 5